MRMRSVVVALLGGAVVFLAGAAHAQDLPDLPGMDQARDQVGGTTAQSPRVPGAAALPGGTAGALSRAPASGTGSPSRLPETGVDTTALALDGLTLLGAGTVLMTIRRRWAAAS